MSNRTAWSWCSSSPKPWLSPPCLSLSEMSTISWWAARTAPSTCRVVMEGVFISKPQRPLPKHGQETEAACSARLGPECQINIAHSLPSATQIQHLISCCLRFHSCPSHPVFLFRLSVVFVKVAQHKQGTHAGETNHFFPFSSPYVSLGESVCLQSVFPGRIKTALHLTMLSFKTPGLLSWW